MNILQVKKYYTFQLEPNDRADQIYIFSFRKSLGKQRKKHVDALKSLNLCIEILNNLTIDKLKEIKQLQNNIKLDTLEYAAKREKY